MRMKAIVAGFAMAAASASFADSFDYSFSNAVPTKSRAEVNAALAAAPADGMSQRVLDTQYPAIVQPSASRSREEVVAELKQFRSEHPNSRREFDYPGVIDGTLSQPRLAAMATPSTSR